MVAGGWQQSTSGTDCGGAALRILLAGINYEPELAGIGPYTTGLAKHFASEGHAVTVATGVPHYPQWRRLPRRTLEPQNNPQVKRYNHFIPRRPRALGRSLYEITWLMSALRSLPRVNADLVIGVVPSLSGAVLAWLIARRCRAPFGVIFQDLIGSAALQSGYTGGKRLAWVASRMELYVARRASGVAIVAEGFRPYLETGGVRPSKIWRVRNWADFMPTVARDQMRRKLNWAPAEFVCLHAGNMGQKQALDNLLEAAGLLEGQGVSIVLAGDGNDRDRLVEKSRKLRFANIRFIDVQPCGLYESMLQAADVLLLNQRPSVSDMALPSKLSAYFAAGKPVVAAAAASSEAARLVAEAGGIVTEAGSPRDLAQALLDLRDNKTTQVDLGMRAQSYFERHLESSIALKRYDDFLAVLVGASAVHSPEPLAIK